MARLSTGKELTTNDSVSPALQKDRPEQLITKARKANEYIAELDKKQGGGRARAAFEKDDYKSQRDLLARAIDQELRKSARWQRRFTPRPRRSAEIPARQLPEGRFVSRIAHDLSTPAFAYANQVAASSKVTRKGPGRPSHFDSPAMHDLFAACARIYESFLGRRGKPGDSNYEGDFQTLVRSVLRALESASSEPRFANRSPASKAKRSLTEAIKRLYPQ